jgi:hypothetical protein
VPISHNPSDGIVETINAGPADAMRLRVIVAAEAIRTLLFLVMASKDAATRIPSFRAVQLRENRSPTISSLLVHSASACAGSSA